MPMFLIKGTYNAEGLKGLRRRKRRPAERRRSPPPVRLAGVNSLHSITRLGRTTCSRFADLPSHVQAASLATAIGSTGMFSNVQTVALLTVPEMDAALGDSMAYRPPGG
jgi:hypothetical protein